jgi:hypothetical protein
MSSRDQRSTQICAPRLVRKDQEPRRSLAYHPAVILQHAHARGYVRVRVGGGMRRLVLGGVDEREAADCYRTRE